MGQGGGLAKRDVGGLAFKAKHLGIIRRFSFVLIKKIMEDNLYIAKTLTLIQSDRSLFENRSVYANTKLGTLASHLGKSERVKSFPQLAIYTAGSYGRLEASPYSDIDLFFVVAKSRDSLPEFRVPEIRLLSDIIDIGFRLDFPKFSNDGEYLKILFAEDILNNLGSPSDDYHNYFTARMLLLLEGRPVYGEAIYSRLLKNIINSYFRDYRNHPDDFRPTFLINDILRFWKTLCLNYEHKRNEEESRARIKHKIKNFKLGFSRLLICFATVAALGAYRKNVTPNIVQKICRMTPVQRLAFAAQTSPAVQQKVVEALHLHSWFLRKTALSTDQLEKYFSVKANRIEAFSRAREFGNKIFEILEIMDKDHSNMRYLVV
ncbi:MAG: hypothetical protein EKK40_06385 [Bradyrhizobiaceae bacterium]|nr:MAG: hypothetical protein EKK40_06385 [Bradyrhizobiaceae bacterium]